MTGLRASMRRRACARCQTSFLPKRTDAEFCSNGCKQADYRARKLKEEADKAFKVGLRIAQNTHDAARQMDLHRFLAREQNVRADSVRHKHIRFMGIQRGVLGVQAYRADDLPWPIPWKPFGRSWLKVRESQHDPANPEAGDPEVIEAVVEALQHETLGGSFMQREYEKECRALLKGAVKRISLFTAEPRGATDSPPSQWLSLEPVTSDYLELLDRWDDNGVQENADSLDVTDLIAGGGFGIFKP
jgi:hypothetical protein